MTAPADAPPALTPFFNPGAQESFSDPTRILAVHYDLFPAEVHFQADLTNHPGATASAIMLPKCRVLISPDAVYVFTDGPRGPVLAFYDTLAPDNSLAQTPTKGYLLTPASPTLTDVSAISVEPTNRCGCGSRLRGYRPFGRISYVPTP